jgi:hypothetical protein
MANNSGYVKLKNVVPDTAGEIVTQNYVNGAARVSVVPAPANQVTQNIYSGTAVGSMITENLDTYTYFQFHVIGVDADDDVSIGISLDGVNFVTIPVINMATGAEIAAGTNIEAAGMYRYGNEPTSVSLRDAPVGMGVKSIRITRETAVGANQVDVIMRAC